MALSPLTLEVLEVLQTPEYIGKNVLTLGLLAERLLPDVDPAKAKAKINGSLMTFRRGGHIAKVDAIDEETNKAVSFIVPQPSIAEFDPASAAPAAKGGPTMKPETVKVLRRLQAMHEAGSTEKVTAADLAEACEITVPQANGACTSFQRKGWIERSQPEGRILPDGRAVNVKYIITLPEILNAVVE